MDKIHADHTRKRKVHMKLLEENKKIADEINSVAEKTDAILTIIIALLFLGPALIYLGKVSYENYVEGSYIFASLFLSFFIVVSKICILICLAQYKNLKPKK